MPDEIRGKWTNKNYKWVNKYIDEAEDVISKTFNKKNSLSGLTPDIIEIINKLLGKFSLTDTVEIVHRIGNIGKKEIYKKALDIQNEK